jgi:hypothetical protein
MMAIGDEHANPRSNLSCGHFLYWMAAKARWAAAMKMWLHDISIREKKQLLLLGEWALQECLLTARNDGSEV